MALRGALTQCLLLATTAVSATAQQSPKPWEQALAVQLAAARSERIPTSLEELANPNLPPEQNAATYLSRLKELDKASPVAKDDSVAVSEIGSRYEPSAEDIEHVRTVLDQHKERLQLIHRMAECPDYVGLPKTIDLPVGTLADPAANNAEFRNCARWLIAEAAVLLSDGKPLEAIKVDSEVFGLARHVGSRGAIIAYLVGQAIDALALGALRKVLYHNDHDPAVAAAVQKAVETEGLPHDLATPLRGEVATTLAFNASVRRDLPKLLKGDQADESGSTSFVKSAEYRTWARKFGYPTDPKDSAQRYFDMNDAHYIAWMRRVIAVADLPFPEATAAISAIKRESEKLSKQPDYMQAAAMVGSADLLPKTKARRHAVEETVRAAAALLAFKAKHGSFPLSLDECMSPAPLDPFDQYPLRYRKEGEGFVVYSIGESGRFDGGSPDRKPEPRNVFFRYPYPSYAPR